MTNDQPPVARARCSECAGNGPAQVRVMQIEIGPVEHGHDENLFGHQVKEALL